jgi:hypothetical protein
MIFFLRRSSLPPTQLGQRATILQCLQPPGTKKSLDQLVRECLLRNYHMHFKQDHTGQDLFIFTARSILYHFEQLGDLIGMEETE